MGPAFVNGSRFWRPGSRDCSAVAKRANQTADKFAGVDTSGQKFLLRSACDKLVVEQNITHGADFPARTSGDIVSLALFGNVKRFPTFGDIVHHRNSGALKLISKSEVLR